MSATKTLSKKIAKKSHKKGHHERTKTIIVIAIKKALVTIAYEFVSVYVMP